MKKIIITGSQGFIGSYLCNEFLNNGYEVIGVDNYSKYGILKRSHDDHPNFKLHIGDICNSSWFESLCEWKKPDFIIAGAAMIGGISYFHKYAYDLIATNERILASTFDAAIKLHKDNILKRIIVLSSSMVYENTNIYPTPETETNNCPVPFSTYGFQKLASEYFALGAWEQYGLPYSVVRPFNCVGLGEEKALGVEEMNENNSNLMLSHVLPDIIKKIMIGQNPVEILGNGEQIRCYTHGKDIARGVRMVVESEAAVNEAFNISTSKGHSVLELAELVWNKLNPDISFNYTSVPGFEYDVQKRIPNVEKAYNVLGFKAELELEDAIDELIEYMRPVYGN
jgi:nucleoside-diphosphate-sugar epimerase